MGSDRPVSEWSVAELEAAIRHHNVAYWENDAPEISDYEYDGLVRRLREVAPDSPVLSEIAAGRVTTESLGATVEHAVPMLSLDKCYTEEEIQRWADAFEGDVVESPKVDGVAASLRYDEGGRLTLAATRGDGRRGEDFTANALLIPSEEVPKSIAVGPLEVRGEIYMPLSAFQRYSEQAANPRNLAAGTLKRKQSDRGQLRDLAFFAYDVLGREFATEEEKLRFLAELGFDMFPFKRRPKAEMQAGYEEWLAQREHVDFELDGVVYKADAVSEQQRLGLTAHHPRYAIAYKFQGESGESTLQNVEWSVARTGVITPVAVIDRIVLSGAEVRRCSLHNLSIVRRHGLRIGDTVVAMRRGGVIPHIELTKGGGTEEVVPPHICPSCDRPTRIEGDFLYCANRDDCPGVIVGVLEHYLSALSVDGFGRKLLDKLIEKGWVRTPADLYTLTPYRLANLERIGDILARKLVANLDAARELTLATFLQSLGIEGVGPTVAEALAQHFPTLPEIRAASADQLAEVDGVGPIVARNVVTGLADRAALIDALLEQVHIEAPPGPTEGPLAGQSVVFTGKLATMDRKDAQRRAREAGATTPSGVTKDLTLLVVGDEGSPLLGPAAKSSKQQKAERYQAEGSAVEIISELEFLERLERLIARPRRPRVVHEHVHLLLERLPSPR